MALQRIIESARKLGVPVIVTDIAGREPFVILPLEQFEAMAGTVGSTAPVAEAAGIRLPPDVRPEVSLAASYPAPEADTVELSKLEQEALPKMSELEEMPLEERFYLEPVDEGEESA